VSFTSVPGDASDLGTVLRIAVCVVHSNSVIEKSRRELVGKKRMAAEVGDWRRGTLFKRRILVSGRAAFQDHRLSIGPRPRSAFARHVRPRVASHPQAKSSISRQHFTMRRC